MFNTLLSGCHVVVMWLSTCSGCISAHDYVIKISRWLLRHCYLVYKTFYIVATIFWVVARILKRGC